MTGLGQEQAQKTDTLAFGSNLYEVIAHSLSFGSRTDGTLLGYVVLGSAINDRVARQVSQATSAEVAFTIDGDIAIVTLGKDLQESFTGISGLAIC